MTVRVSNNAWAVSVGLLIALVSESAAAAGFQLLHQSQSGLGTAFAGSAAIAEDASTGFFNPAGLARLGGREAKSGWNVVVGVAAILPSSKFSNTGSMPALGSSQPLGDNGGNAGNPGYPPGIHAAYHSGNRWGVGLSIGAPFGLGSEYGSDWVGRYVAIKSTLFTAQTGLAAGYSLTDRISIGAGVNYLVASARLTNAVNWGPFGDGLAQLKGHDGAWGYNFGALWKATDYTKFGLDYRSGYKLVLRGDVQTSFPGTQAQLAALGPLAQAGFTAANGNTRVDLRLPDTATLSAVHALTPKWDLLADIAWIHWSVFKQIEVVRDNGLTLTKVPENWRDTWRFAIGTAYQITPTVKLRGGVAYDQSPVRNEFRTPSIPDSDWRWLTAGAQFVLSKNWKIDIAYAHISVKKASINATRYDGAGNPDPTSGTLIGNYKTSSNTFGLQFVGVFNE